MRRKITRKRKKKGMSLNKIFLISMIIFFAISGILGASFFLFGVFGAIQGKILLTTSVLGIFSLLGLVSSKNLEEKARKRTQKKEREINFAIT